MAGRPDGVSSGREDGSGDRDFCCCCSDIAVGLVGLVGLLGRPSASLETSEKDSLGPRARASKKEYSLSVAGIAGAGPRGAICVVIIKRKKKEREERRGGGYGLS